MALPLGAIPAVQNVMQQQTLFQALNATPQLMAQGTGAAPTGVPGSQGPAPITQAPTTPQTGMQPQAQPQTQQQTPQTPNTQASTPQKTTPTKSDTSSSKSEKKSSDMNNKNILYLMLQGYTKSAAEKTLEKTIKKINGPMPKVDDKTKVEREKDKKMDKTDVFQPKQASMNKTARALPLSSVAKNVGVAYGAYKGGKYLESKTDEKSPKKTETKKASVTPATVLGFSIGLDKTAIPHEKIEKVAAAMRLDPEFVKAAFIKKYALSGLWKGLLAGGIGLPLAYHGIKGMANWLNPYGSLQKGQPLVPYDTSYMGGMSPKQMNEWGQIGMQERLRTQQLSQMGKMMRDAYNPGQSPF